MQDENKLLSAVADTLIEKPKYEFTIDVSWQPEYRPTLWDRITRRPKPPTLTEQTFIINPCKVGSMYRIASKAQGLPTELRGGTYSEVYLPLIYSHINDIIYIVASGIQNNHLEPDPKLMLFIERNFDAIDLYNCLAAVLENINMESFFNSIVLIKGAVTILKASPADGSE
jgi:hypothetical protein